MKAGAGSVELDLTASLKAVSGSLEYRHKIAEGLAVFGRARGGYEYAGKPFAEAIAGLRYNF